MNVDVHALEDPDEWNDLVRRAADPTPFHLAEALDVMAAESGTTAHRLVGYKGKEPVGCVPTFTKSIGPISAAFSPPPKLKVPSLGPLLTGTQQPKRRRQELRNSGLVDAWVEWLEETHDPRFVTLRSVPTYDDIRPFLWNGYEATPRHTYVIDLTRGADDLLESFSSDARRNVTREHDVDFEVEEGGVPAIERILPEVIALHEAQGEPFPFDAGFVTALYEALPDGVVRPVVCHVDGEFAGGQVYLEFAGTGTCWLSVADREVDLPVTDVLDWEYIQGAIDDGMVAYDLAGANKKRLSRYKAKFDPVLRTYYRLEQGSWSMTAASRLYNRFR